MSIERKAGFHYCDNCDFVTDSVAFLSAHYREQHSLQKGTGRVAEMIEEAKREQAKRDPVQYRFDILYPEFLREMARIADYGAKKYGEYNWTKSRLKGGQGPMSHIFEHMNQYNMSEPYDHTEIGTDRKIHLAAIAFNAMMEYWYEDHPTVK